MTEINGDGQGTPGQSDGSVLFEVSDDQIKHLDRVRDLAEVYTHYREVTAMLDMVPDVFPSAFSDTKF